jgi:hypothetical protein
MPEYDPPVAFYTQVSIPEHVDAQAFIGRDGCHLKRITELSHCEYLWFDFTRRVVEVWGKHHRLPKAVRMLNKRVDSFATPTKTLFSQEDPSIIVTTWNHYPKFTSYEIIGPEANAMKFYLEKILKEYPSNPYFTDIESKESHEKGIKMIVKRSSTCE